MVVAGRVYGIMTRSPQILFLFPDSVRGELPLRLRSLVFVFCFVHVFLRRSFPFVNQIRLQTSICYAY